jgi:hypothetical protein
MTNVFISYRRSDTTSGYASWIYDRLAVRHGSEHVFMDMDSLPLGVDFVDHVQRALATTDVALVLIGPNWLGATDAGGGRRLDDPSDFVRIEVAAALRSSSRVIPVLVDGADMPSPDELPEELRPLTRRQGLPFHRQGGGGINELLTTIEEMVRGGVRARPTADPIRPPEPPSKARQRRRLALVSAGALVLAAGIAIAVVASGGSSSRGNTSSTHTGTTTTTQSTTNTTQPPLGPQLTAAQLTPVLVPQSAFDKLLPDFYPPPTDQDQSAYALHGGLPSLNLCSSPIPASGLGADTSSSYRAIPYGVRATIYFGSDAGSFAGQGAATFLNTAAARGSTCGWRSLPGPTLDDQVVRLTSDQQNPDANTLHDDVILVRDRSCVVEVATATTAGTHSSDAETLADDAAKRLAQAVAAA